MYQTLVEKEAVVQGVPDGASLAAAVASVTENFLGPSAAYCEIGTGRRRADTKYS
jgi:hypothetical protein